MIPPASTAAAVDEAMPLVSIVIPCYNGAAYLPKALDSCIHQSYRNIEVIVVDDQSPDDCADIADKYAARDPRVRVIRRPKNGGVSAAFNTGYEAARGNLFSRLAQDDWFREDAIALMVTNLAKNPDVGLVYCDQFLVNEAGAIIRLDRKPAPEISETQFTRRIQRWHDALAEGNKIGLCVMWRRAVWEKIGGFDPHYDTVDDYEYWLRLSQHFLISYCPEPAIYVRLHEQMGSKVYFVKQQLLAAQAGAKYMHGFVKKRRHLACCYFDTGYRVGTEGKRSTAVKLLARSLLFWPFNIKPFKSIIRFLCFG